MLKKEINVILLEVSEIKKKSFRILNTDNRLKISSIIRLNPKIKRKYVVTITIHFQSLYSLFALQVLVQSFFMSIE